MTQATSDAASPSLLRRPGCWITFLTVIPLLIGVMYFMENWFGARQLARAKARVAADGIELDPTKLPLTRPPEAENFFTTPLLAAITRGTATGPEIEAVKRIAKWQSGDYNLSKPHPRLQSPRAPTPTDWAALRDAIAAADPAAGLTASDPETAKKLSESLERDLAPVFSELSAAMTRPHSVLVPTWLDEVRAGKGHNTGHHGWMNDIRKLAAVHYLRATLDVELKNEARAVESCRILLRLADGTEAYGTMIGQLVGISIRSLAHHVVWSAACQRALSKQAWLALAADFRGQRPLNRFPAAIHHDMIFAHLGIKDLRAEPQNLWATSSLPYVTPGPPSQWHRWAGSLVPRGWFDANEANVLEGYAAIARRVQNPALPDRFNLDESIRQWIEPNGMLGHRLLAQYTIAAAGSLANSSASSHAITRLAEAACGLEAYALDHQTYPESLAALVPAYLPAVPLDLDGSPLRYALDPGNGRYKLWSLGSNGTDDGGQIETDRRGRWKYPLGSHNEDWVWAYPTPKPAPESKSSRRRDP